jgi:CRP-like cAMP-binding protein
VFVLQSGACTAYAGGNGGCSGNFGVGVGVGVGGGGSRARRNGVVVGGGGGRASGAFSPGDVVGGLSFFGGADRSETVRATETCVLLAYTTAGR